MKKVHNGGRHYGLGECNAVPCGCWDCACMSSDLDNPKCQGDKCMACASFDAELRKCCFCSPGMTWHRIDTGECLRCKEVDEVRRNV